MDGIIAQKDIETWADYLLNHSLEGIRSEDIVMIKGEHITWPLMSVLQDKIFAAGALADINIVSPDNDRGKVWGASMARFGSISQIEKVPKWHLDRYQAMTKYIEILGAENPALFAHVPDNTSKAITIADEPAKSIRSLKSWWVLTLYPTQAFADMEGMSLQEYTDIIVQASTTNPNILEEAEAEIYKIMAASKEVRIQTRHPETGRSLELYMNIDNEKIIKCTGARNFPDGEVFTSPDASSVQGEIFIDLPVSYSGVTMRGIYLRIEKGIIKEYRSKEGSDTLKKIIETDEGSHRIGEIALGMNNGIEKVLKHPLFVEKVGGTLHIAIGASYPECFVDDPASESGRKQADALFKQGKLNRSAQHVDIVVDFRTGGAGQTVYFDNKKLEIENNIWIVPEL
jgi:aminopeptidase